MTKCTRCAQFFIRAHFQHCVCSSSLDQLFHKQGLGGHWEDIRPGLLRNIFSTKVHLARGSPICILTATITPEELAQVTAMFGQRRKPLLVASGPILSHTKICCVRRPGSNVHLLGSTRMDGSHQPGDLEFLRAIVLDKFVDSVRLGTLEDFPKTIIFFRQVFIHLRKRNQIGQWNRGLSSQFS